MNKLEIRKKIKKLDSKIYKIYNTYTDICSNECMQELNPIFEEKKQLKKMLKENEYS